MADENDNPEDVPQPAGGDDAESGTATPTPDLKILAHFVRDLSFENVAAQKGGQSQGTPEINVTVNLDGGSIAENRYQLGMKINATAKIAESTRFIVELDYVGVFEIANVPKEHIHPFLFIECPRQILPYARRVVSDVTRDGGFPPLMLDNIDFTTLYRQKLVQMRAEQGDTPAN